MCAAPSSPDTGPMNLAASSPPREESAWERSLTRKLVSAGWPGVLVAAAIAAQFLVPFAALGASAPPTRFGFQMYSGMGGALAQQTDTQGRTSDIDLARMMVTFRAELDWSDLPERLCAVSPSAATITVKTVNTTGPHERTVTCRR